MYSVLFVAKTIVIEYWKVVENESDTTNTTQHASLYLLLLERTIIRIITITMRAMIPYSFSFCFSISHFSFFASERNSYTRHPNTTPRQPCLPARPSCPR